MAIYNRDEVYDREDNPNEFLLKCDSDAGCPQLLFSLDDWYGFSEPRHSYTLNVCLIPHAEPWSWLVRLRLAWEMLTRGRLKYRDDMVLDVETVKLLSDKLAELADKMGKIHYDE